MLSLVVGIISLSVFARLAFELTRPWFQREIQEHPKITASKRGGALILGGLALYLVLASLSDFTSRRMVIYDEGLRTATSSKVFADQIGEPFSVTWPIILKAGVSDQGNDASIKITVKGPHGKGVIFISGKKGTGGWNLTGLYLLPSLSGHYVNLLPSETTLPTPH
jgi:hypothetical protein